MPALLNWLDESAAHYGVLAWTAFGLLAVSALLPCDPRHRWRRWNRPGLFAGLLLVGLIAFRWPGLAQNHELHNPDESQLLASALTYRHFHGIWAQVDGMSSGPLVALPLVLPGLIGLPVDYTTARGVGLLLAWGSVVLLWLVLRRAHGDRPGRILTLPAVCVLSFTHYWDFVQYSSEQAPVFYCLLALWLVVTALTKSGAVHSRLRLGLGGVVLGLLPLAKLQLAPLGLVIGVTAAFWTLQQPGGDWRRRTRDLSWLIGGTALSLALVAGSILLSRQGSDFWQIYVVSNFFYGDGRVYPWRFFSYALWFLAHQAEGFPFYAVPVVLLLAAALPGWNRLVAEVRRLTLLAGGLFITGLFVVIAPGRLFPHYLQILILPASLLLGLLYGTLITGDRFRRKVLMIALFLLIGVGPQIWYRIRNENPFLGKYQPDQPRAASAVAQRVLNYARPGDTLAVWGWMPKYYVETGLPQAAREAQTQRQIVPHPLTAYLRARFLADLQRNQPAVFLDAVGARNFGYQNRVTMGHEINIPLRDFIAARYELVADLETTRIYVRRDRLAQQSAHTDK